MRDVGPRERLHPDGDGGSDRREVREIGVDAERHGNDDLHALVAPEVGAVDEDRQRIVTDLERGREREIGLSLFLEGGASVVGARRPRSRPCNGSRSAGGAEFVTLSVVAWLRDEGRAAEKEERGDSRDGHDDRHGARDERERQTLLDELGRGTELRLVDQLRAASERSRLPCAVASARRTARRSTQARPAAAGHASARSLGRRRPSSSPTACTLTRPVSAGAAAAR